MKMGGVGRGVKHTAIGGGGVGTSGASGGQYISEMGYRDRATNSIAEDDEALDDESTSFAVTGTSGFFRKGMGTSTTISKIISIKVNNFGLPYCYVYVKFIGYENPPLLNFPISCTVVHTMYVGSIWELS